MVWCAMWQALKDGGRLMVYVEAEGGSADMIAAYQAASASFGPKIESPLAGEVSLASFLGEACEPLPANQSAVWDKSSSMLAVVVRGRCTFVDKVRHAQTAGALGVIVTNNKPGAPISLGGSSHDISIPAVMITQEDGEGMINLTRAAPRGKLTVELTVAHSLPSFHQVSPTLPTLLP